MIKSFLTKITAIEKAVIVVIIIIIISIPFMIHDCNRKIEKAGGMKQIIIDVGKEAKDIKKEIEDHGNQKGN